MELYQSVINMSLDDVKIWLQHHQLELRNTHINDHTYLIKYTPETDISDMEINHLRGLIYDINSHQIYSMTYPVPLDYTVMSENVQKSITSSQYTIEELYDGSLIRLSYVDDQHGWMCSTNGKDDAREAFWMNNMSFYEQFMSSGGSEIFVDTLNKNYVYLFVVCHPQNIIVVNYQKPTIYHVATIDKTTGSEVDIDIGISKPKVYQYTIEQALNLATDMNNAPVTSAGYMVLVKRANGLVSRYRIECAGYRIARQLRGNCNDIEQVLLDLYCKSEVDVDLFMRYYPMYTQVYKHLLHTLNNLVDYLTTVYTNRRTGHVYVPQASLHYLLKEIHQVVYLDKLKHLHQSVNRTHIRNYLCSLPTSRLLWYLRI